MSKIDLSKLITAETKAATALNEARFRARTAVRKALDDFEAGVVGDYPQSERDSWPKQERAARDFTVNGDGAAQASLDLLDARCAVTGETRAQLADKIIANADALAPLALWLSGMRYTAMSAIDAAVDMAEVEAAWDDALAIIAAGPSA